MESLDYIVETGKDIRFLITLAAIIGGFIWADIQIDKSFKRHFKNFDNIFENIDKTSTRFHGQNAKSDEGFFDKYFPLILFLIVIISLTGLTFWQRIQIHKFVNEHNVTANEWNLEDAIAVAKEEGREEERNTIFNLWQ